MAKQSSIYRLLQIKPGSWKMLLLLFPPAYSLWLFAMGKSLLQRQNKSDKVFTVLSSGTATAMFLSFFTPLLLAIIGADMTVLGYKAIPFTLLTSVFWFGTLGMLTRITVQYDRDANPDYHYNAISSLDYVKRFLAFFYWPFTIWSLQKNLNGYLTGDRPSS